MTRIMPGTLTIAVVCRPVRRCREVDAGSRRWIFRSWTRWTGSNWVLRTPLGRSRHSTTRSRSEAECCFDRQASVPGTWTVLRTSASQPAVWRPGVPALALTGTFSSLASSLGNPCTQRPHLTTAWTDHPRIATASTCTLRPGYVPKTIASARRPKTKARRKTGCGLAGKILPLQRLWNYDWDARCPGHLPLESSFHLYDRCTLDGMINSPSYYRSRRQ